MASIIDSLKLWWPPAPARWEARCQKCFQKFSRRKHQNRVVCWDLGIKGVCSQFQWSRCLSKTMKFYTVGNFQGSFIAWKESLAIILRPDIEQKALRHRQMSLHCFLTSFVRVARAEQVEKTGRLEEKEEEESLLGGNRQLCPGLWRWWPMCGGSYILVKKWWPICEGNCILV